MDEALLHAQYAAQSVWEPKEKLRIQYYMISYYGIELTIVVISSFKPAFINELLLY